MQSNTQTIVTLSSNRMETTYARGAVVIDFENAVAGLPCMFVGDGHTVGGILQGGGSDIVPSLQQVLFEGNYNGNYPIVGEVASLACTNTPANSIEVNATETKLVNTKGEFNYGFLQTTLTRLLGGLVFGVTDAIKSFFFDSALHDIKVGINTDTPAVALDVVGDATIINNEDKGLHLENSNWSIGDDYGNGYSFLSGNYTQNIVTIRSNNIALSDSSYLQIKGEDNKMLLKALHINTNSLQNFATNAAAITGGLAVGDLYYTNTAGQATLKIVV